MKAYSVDLRERIVAAVKEEGLSKTEVARRFKVDRSTVYSYLSKHQAGDLAPKRPPGRSQKLSAEEVEQLREQVKQHRDLTLLEHAERFEAEHGIRLGFSTVRLYFKRLGISRKKKPLRQ